MAVVAPLWAVNARSRGARDLGATQAQWGFLAAARTTRAAVEAGMVVVQVLDRLVLVGDLLISVGLLLVLLRLVLELEMVK